MRKVRLDGRMPKDEFDFILDAIDYLKGNGYFFVEHDREEKGDWVSFYYELNKNPKVAEKQPKETISATISPSKQPTQALDVNDAQNS